MACHPHSVSEGVFNQRVGRNLGVGTGEVKSEATVFGFHPRRECATCAQIDRGFRGVPIIRCRVPPQDVFGRRIGAAHG